jgi:hypothetical protein
MSLLVVWRENALHDGTLAGAEGVVIVGVAGGVTVFALRYLAWSELGQVPKTDT